MASTPLVRTYSSGTLERIESSPASVTWGLACFLALLSCALYSFNGELLQFLQGPDSSQAPPIISPMLNVVLCHLGGLLFAPHFLFWRHGGIDGGREGGGVSVRRGSLFCALILMGYNYAWLLSARHLATGVTNAIFQSSIALIFVAGVFLFRDTTLAPAQLLGVAFAIGGAFLAGAPGGGGTDEAQVVWFGVFLASCASVGNAVYQVAFKYLYGHLKEDFRFLAHFGCWVSLWHVLVILPLVVLAHLVGFETLEFPTRGLDVLETLTSACIASTVNALYICIIMWGATMLLPCASALSVPCTVMLDFLLHHTVMGRVEACGYVMVVLSVFLILDLHKAVLRCFRNTGEGNHSREEMSS